MLTEMDWHSDAWGFETERLRVIDWLRRGEEKLADFLVSALTPEVTRELPPTWGGFSRARAPAWIAERHREGTMFLVEAKDPGNAVGLFMFFPGGATRHRGEVRLGYVLAESAWGRGYATELLQGFVRRWDEKGVTANLLASVTVSNAASQRVLEKAGFSRSGEGQDVLVFRRKVLE